MRQLSSEWTIFYKFIFPAIWIGGMGLGTSLLFREVSPKDPAERWIFLGATLLGAALYYWMGMRLKSVYLRGSDLIVSNFRREIVVPLRDVERVTGSILINPELMWLHLRHPTDLGERVIFMPYKRFSLRFDRHPLVEESNTLTRQASI